MRRLKFVIFLVYIGILYALPVTEAFAQIGEVEIVVSGTGITKEAAVNNALRSAIEQSFGAFVSSNTAILNDEIVKDEIVTVSSGTIKKYYILSLIHLPDNLTEVSLQVNVSTAKLTEYAASHGASVEFNGALIGANIEVERFYEKNEETALYNLMEQVSRMQDIFDYQIAVKDYKHNSVTVELTIYANKNTQLLVESVVNTLSALGTEEKRLANRESLGLRWNRMWLNETSYVNLRCDSGIMSTIRSYIDRCINNFQVSSNLSSPVPYNYDWDRFHYILTHEEEDWKEYHDHFNFYSGKKWTWRWKGHPIINQLSQDVFEMALPFSLVGHDISSKQIRCKKIDGKLLGKYVWQYSVPEKSLIKLTNLYIEPLPEEIKYSYPPRMRR